MKKYIVLKYQSLGSPFFWRASNRFENGRWVSDLNKATRYSQPGAYCSAYQLGAVAAFAVDGLTRSEPFGFRKLEVKS